MALNVMLVESEAGVSDEAARELREAGHTTLRCHQAGDAAFPCVGISDPAACPLRSHDVDVALLVRAGTLAQPTVREDGARCALVQRVPLVVAGPMVLDPYDAYATRTVDAAGDVVGACEAAAGAPIEAFGARASAVLAASLGEAGPVALAHRVEVTRRHGRLQVHVADGATMTKDQRSRAAVRITGALRELDPFATGIDVGFDGADT